eukprot:SM000054S18077  [mRNA]  locus=s54:231987:233524:- [translate_table: standard]
MILAVLIFNGAGKPRLTKFYAAQARAPFEGRLPASCSPPLAKPEKQQEMLRKLCAILSKREDTWCNFVVDEATFGEGTKVVNRKFATLYFACIVDSAESELGILDLIQVIVETLDLCFSNDCELDIAYNFTKVHQILDEIIVGGQVFETNPAEIVKAVDEMQR